MSLLDGKKVATVDRYTSSNGWQVPVFTSGTLSSGSHTIEIVRTGARNAKSGGSNLLIDAIVVTDAGTATTTSSSSTASTTTSAPITTAAATAGRCADHHYYLNCYLQLGQPHR